MMKKVLSLLLLANLYLFADPIKIGMDSLYPPFEYLDSDGNIKGFDVDLTAELAKRIGFEYEIVKLDYDSICEAVNEKKVDIGISAFGDDESTQNCDHGISYVETELIFVKDKSRTDINSLEDLQDKKIAFENNSVLRDIVKDLGAKPIVKKIGTFISTLLLLHEGKVDSVVLYNTYMPILKGNLASLSDDDKDRLGLIMGGLNNFVVFYQQPSDDAETFIIFPKNGEFEELKNKINEAIKQMRSDGTIQNLLSKYDLK